VEVDISSATPCRPRAVPLRAEQHFPTDMNGRAALALHLNMPACFSQIVPAVAELDFGDCNA
jgi:hypothetical protein